MEYNIFVQKSFHNAFLFQVSSWTLGFAAPVELAVQLTMTKTAKQGHISCIEPDR